MSLFIVKKGLFLSVYVDDIKLAGEKQNVDPMWKLLNKEVAWENQHLSLIMKTWDALKDNVNSAKILWTIQNHVRISNFSGKNRKTSIPPKSSYFFMVV